MTKTYCDNCGRDKPVKKVILKDDSGWADYCDDCRINSQRKLAK